MTETSTNSLGFLGDSFSERNNIKNCIFLQKRTGKRLKRGRLIRFFFIIHMFIIHSLNVFLEKKTFFPTKTVTNCSYAKCNLIKR